MKVAYRAVLTYMHALHVAAEKFTVDSWVFDETYRQQFEGVKYNSENLGKCIDLHIERWTA